MKEKRLKQLRRVLFRNATLWYCSNTHYYWNRKRYSKRICMKNFKQAQETTHAVEDQWHYPIMIKHGYKSQTKEGVGFVRRYVYVKDGHEVICITGINSDRWEDNKGNSGFWDSLESNLNKDYDK